MRGREHSALGVLTDMSDMVELAIAATIQRYTGRRKSMRVDYTLRLIHQPDLLREIYPAVGAPE